MQRRSRSSKSMRAVTRGQSIPDTQEPTTHTTCPHLRGWRASCASLRCTSRPYTQRNIQQGWSQQHTNTAAGPLPHVQPNGGTRTRRDKTPQLVAAITLTAYWSSDRLSRHTPHFDGRSGRKTERSAMTALLAAPFASAVLGVPLAVAAHERHTGSTLQQHGAGASATCSCHSSSWAAACHATAAAALRTVRSHSNQPAPGEGGLEPRF